RQHWRSAVRRSIRLRLALAVCLLAAPYAVSQTQQSSTDPVMRAMVDELGRSITELQFKDLEKPYFIQYIALDQERFRVSATFGALTASDVNRARFIQAQVRVGG